MRGNVSIQNSAALYDDFAPHFKKEWDENESRYQRMLMVLHARNEEHLTRSELAERTGLRQSDISCN